MKIKRILALFLTLSMLFSLIACNKDISSGSSNTESNLETNDNNRKNQKPSEFEKSDDSDNSIDVIENSKDFANKKTYKKISVEYEPEPITSEEDGLLRKNPDRAWRGEAFVNVSGINWGWGAQPDPTVNVRRFFETYAKYKPQLCQTYFYLTSYRDKIKIDERGMRRIQEVFDCAKDLNVKLVVRFAYQPQMDHKELGASDEIMLSHMKQLKPILEKNKNYINVVEAGFLGAWGEWHSYDGEHDRAKLLREIVDMTPKEIYVQIREPFYKDVIPNTDPIYSRLGNHNDSFFGKRVCNDTHANPGNKVWIQLMEESGFTPTGGETFWGSQTSEEIDGWDSILEFKEHRHNTFSISHCFIEDGYDTNYPMLQWEKEYVNTDWLDKNSVFYAPGWFYDKNGKPVKRSVFDFVSDYLGYKMEIRNVKIDGILKPGEQLKVRTELVNYGFSAAFNMYSGYAILDENGKEVASVDSGKPSTWNSRSPYNIHSDKMLSHKMLANIKLPEKSGKYKLAIYFRNSAGMGARFGNIMEYENGYTTLYEFEY